MTVINIECYSVGFLVHPPTDSVLLVRKNRPEWQKGKLNGIGGHVEGNESFDQCMAREFREETGIEDDLNWHLMVRMMFPRAYIWFYRAVAEDLNLLYSARSVTDENVHVFRLNQLLESRNIHGALPNLRWLLPLAMYTYDEYLDFEVWAEHHHTPGGNDAPAQL